jgi:isocitrate dehydrogenase
MATRISVAHGDGIGPELMDTCLSILRAGGAKLDIEPVEIGEKAYRAGIKSGIADSAWDSIARTKVIYKAPISTPAHSRFRSPNVTLRKTLGLFASVRPCVAYAPFVASKHPGMNVVVIRENEEDLYAGIEHRQTDETYHCMKLVSRPGSEKLIRYAFEYAVAHGRGKITCLTKDNVMRMSDGLVRRIFEEVGADYPQIKQEHRLVDIGAARLAKSPEDFDVIVTTNLYGDIISDIAAELSGTLWLSPSASIGLNLAMFETIHGAAPSLAGKDIANPSGLLLTGVKMLVHLGQTRAAETVHNAWLATIEDGLHTADLYKQGQAKQRLRTSQFRQAVIDRLGQLPRSLPPVSYAGEQPLIVHPPKPSRRTEKQLRGWDIFIDCPGANAADLAARLQAACIPEVSLTLIANRAVEVWPTERPETFKIDKWRCRFEQKGNATLDAKGLPRLLTQFADASLDVVKAEGLYAFNGVIGYSSPQEH